MPLGVDEAVVDGIIDVEGDIEGLFDGSTDSDGRYDSDGASLGYIDGLCETVRVPVGDTDGSIDVEGS